MKTPRTLICASLLGLSLILDVARADDPPRQQVEIYRIAPGKHVEFLRLISLYDAANVEAGLPPRQLYVHQDGAEWDFMIIQSAEDWTTEQRAKFREALKRMDAPTGAQFFIEVRKLMAEHTDTVVTGPTTAAAWLKELE
ncbi:MAG: hypothetical protein CMLOHMNK_02971 [Steroidobacteraceae bacterium]|nr:hypothetical protein [Steroidobacteraceae bacterium]